MPHSGTKQASILCSIGHVAGGRVAWRCILYERCLDTWTSRDILWGIAVYSARIWMWLVLEGMGGVSQGILQASMGNSGYIGVFLGNGGISGK